MLAGDFHEPGGIAAAPCPQGPATPAGSSQGGGGPCPRLEPPTRTQHCLYTSLEDKPAQGNPISQCKVLSPFSFPFFPSRSEGKDAEAPAQWVPQSRTSFPQAGVSAAALQAQKRHHASQNNHLKMLLLQVEVPLASPTRVIPFCPNLAKSLHSGVICSAASPLYPPSACVMAWQICRAGFNVLPCDSAH